MPVFHAPENYAAHGCEERQSFARGGGCDNEPITGVCTADFAATLAVPMFMTIGSGLGHAKWGAEHLRQCACNRETGTAAIAD